ncbi:MAG: putative ABC transporter permease [Clostridia bacterium]
MEFLVSVFTIGSIAGYLAETLWCAAAYHVIESRQGMVFGPFSQVYGIGAVLLTLIISKNSSKTKTFLISAVVGGIYEYACSYIQERLFGTVSWDYGDGFFSVGGRTSLIFCVFWGLMGILLINYINPALSSVLSKIHGMGKTVVSAVVTVFFILNLQLSYMAVKRQTGRRMNIPPSTEIEEWLDLRFNDDVLKEIYPNMRVVSSE